MPRASTSATAGASTSPTACGARLPSVRSTTAKPTRSKSASATASPDSTSRRITRCAMTAGHDFKYTVLGFAIAVCICGRSLHAQNPVVSDDVADYLYQPKGFFPEPGVITRAAIFGERHFGNSDEGNGRYLSFAHMIPGAGWISGGPGYRKWASQD